MKKLSYLLLLFFSLSLVSCSSDDSSGTNEEELYLRFTVDGTNYNFDPETITSLSRLIEGNQENNSIFTRISLWMPVTPVVGSHSITDDLPNDDNIDTLYNADFWLGDVTYTATTGTFEVTEFNNEYIKGTFSFTGEDENGNTKTISNGTFRAYR